jgi:hypothetical protein
LVHALQVGVDGTDKELNAAEYGQAPPCYDFLVIGHECFGRVLEIGPNVTEFVPGNYVVPTVRRPGGGGTTAAKRLFGKALRESDVPETSPWIKAVPTTRRSLRSMPARIFRT